MTVERPQRLRRLFTPRYLLGVVAAMSVGAMMSVASAANVTPREFFTIGTGLIRGVYFPIGGAICQLVNLGMKDHGMKCLLESTDGSLYNLNALRSGDMDFGVAQSDWQYHAYHGTSVFKKQGPFKDLRTVFTLHSEPFTIVARKDRKIRSFADLKGKRVNIGNAGSGTRITMDVVMATKGWKYSDFARTSELKASEELERAFCEGQIDAFVHTIGHPNTLVEKVTATCDGVLVPMEFSDVEKLLKTYPFYVRAGIPAGMYRNMPQDIPSFGVKAMLVTTANENPRIVRQVLQSVFGSKKFESRISGSERVEDNFENFRTLHPVFTTLDKNLMAKEGLVAPLHDEALKYFREIGLLGADETPEVKQ